MLAVLLAVGLDPKRSVIFHQDEVRSVIWELYYPVELRIQNPHHAELAWILNCITPMGKLRRMTTWKVRSFTLTTALLPTLPEVQARRIAKRAG